MTAILTVRDLGIRAGARSIVDGASFQIDAGRTLALIGESGSGKSMTALAIMGLLPPGVACTPATRIALIGAALHPDDEAAMRTVRGRDVAMVFQDPMSCLNPFMTVGDQIAEAVRRRTRADGTPDRVPARVPARASDRRARVEALLAAVELPDPATMRRRRPHELSGGQQQRVMIAMALAAEPRLLIADEPTSALDTSVQAEVLGLLERLQSRLGMAMLFITHDLGVAARLAHDVAVMHAGRLVEQGSIAAVFGQQHHPHTRALVEVRRMLEVPPPGADPGVRSGGPPPGETALALETVSCDYAGRTPFGRHFRAVHAVSLTLGAGRTLGVIGESGSGKSTLGAAAAGLMPPAAGDVRLFGTALRALRFRLPLALRRRCQIVMQNPYGALNPRHRVGTALHEPLALLRLGTAAERSARVLEVLGEVGLPIDLLQRFPHQLSGGQRQRVCIARALLSRPELLICDEVVSALDVTVQGQILALLKRLQARARFALLFISHDLEVVRWMADDIAVMERGRLVECGPAAAVLHTPHAPATRRLLANRLPALRPPAAVGANARPILQV